MIKKFFDWTKSNKLATVIIFLLIIFAIYKTSPSYFGGGTIIPMMGYYNDGVQTNTAGAVGIAGKMMNSFAFRSNVIPPQPQVAPNLDITNRKVITEASMSLQVKSVNDMVTSIKSKVAELNGYVVNVFVNRPEFGESATVTVRVPSDKIETFIAFAHDNAVKVVNENVSGADITDQYVDTQTRLLQLTEQMAVMQNIMRSAKTVDDIMKVEPYISDLQTQIDNLKGQQNYTDQASKSSLITMYLSTDELSLPYTLDLAWRPQVIFKNAVRSLLIHLQALGGALIWIGVYSVIIVPALTIVLIIYMLRKRKQ